MHGLGASLGANVGTSASRWYHEGAVMGSRVKNADESV